MRGLLYFVLELQLLLHLLQDCAYINLVPMQALPAAG